MVRAGPADNDEYTLMPSACGTAYRTSILVVLSAFLSAPGAYGQPLLYVVDEGHGSIGAYNAVTGAAVDARLVNGQGLNQPSGLALTGNSRLLVANPGNDTVGAYDAATGVTINASFIPFTSSPRGLVVDAQNHLFAVGSAVGEYDATTGATINAAFISGSQLGIPVTALLDGRGHILVTNGPGGRVGEYDAATGATINASFITGLNTPIGMALDTLGHLFVSQNPDINNDAIAECDAVTGAIINPSFIPGLTEPTYLALDNSGHLFVSTRSGGGAVGEYDAITGAAVNPNFITGLNSPAGLVFVVPEPDSLALLGATAAAACAWVRRRTGAR